MRRILIIIVLVLAGCLITYQYQQYKRKKYNIYSNGTQPPPADDVNLPIHTAGLTECSQCGHKFSGFGLTEVAVGVWEESSEQSQSTICSYSCGLKSTGRWEAYMEDLRSRHPEEKEEREKEERQRKVSRYYSGQDGRIYENSACSLCNGTGIETATARNPVTGVVERRICPMCEGRRSQSY